MWTPSANKINLVSGMFFTREFAVRAVGHFSWLFCSRVVLPLLELSSAQMFRWILQSFCYFDVLVVSIVSEALRLSLMSPNEFLGYIQIDLKFCCNLAHIRLSIIETVRFIHFFYCTSKLHMDECALHHFFKNGTFLYVTNCFLKLLPTFSLSLNFAVFQH